jgi:hypothetical protein
MYRESGGAEGVRTPYLHTASVTFSQLNYGPNFKNSIFILHFFESHFQFFACLIIPIQEIEAFFNDRGFYQEKVRPTFRGRTRKIQN